MVKIWGILGIFDPPSPPMGWWGGGVLFLFRWENSSIFSFNLLNIMRWTGIVLVNSDLKNEIFKIKVERVENTGSIPVHRIMFSKLIKINPLAHIDTISRMKSWLYIA